MEIVFLTTSTNNNYWHPMLQPVVNEVVEHHEVLGSYPSRQTKLVDFFPSVLVLVDKVSRYLLVGGSMYLVGLVEVRAS